MYLTQVGFYCKIQLLCNISLIYSAVQKFLEFQNAASFANHLSMQNCKEILPFSIVNWIIIKIGFGTFGKMETN